MRGAYAVPLPLAVRFWTEFERCKRLIRHRRGSSMSFARLAAEDDDLHDRVTERMIEPAEVGAPQQRPSILAYGAGYQYKGNRTYRFTADLIPDFIIQNEAKTKFCIYSRKYEIYESGTRRAVWAELLRSQSSVNYKVFIGDQDFTGAIDGFFAPGTLRASFAAEDAQDCGSQPTRRF